MAVTQVNGLSIAHEVIGDAAARPWAITPGGRFSMTSPGVRELAVALAERGNRVLIWDRPNCGGSDVCFTGPSESANPGAERHCPGTGTWSQAPSS